MTLKTHKTRQDVYSTGEVARICQCAPRLVAAWFDSGVLGGYRLPGSPDRRIPREQLIRFMRAHEMPLPDWMTDRPRLLALSASPLPWLAVPGWDVERTSCAFYAGRLYAERCHPAVLLDFSLGRAESLCVARVLAGHDRPPLLVALCCDDEADEAGLAASFGLVLSCPAPARLARFLGGAP